jgi:hypothetical protein
MRDAIDLYKKAADEGRIQQKDVDQKGFPGSRRARGRVEVVDVATGMSHTVHYLQRFPSIPSPAMRMGQALVSRRLGFDVVGR